MRAQVFELLDFPKFSRPSVSEIRIPDTVESLRMRLSEKSFMSYSQIWPSLTEMVRSGFTEDAIVSRFSSYNDEWKNKSIRSAASCLNAMLGGRGTWYPNRSVVRNVCGFVMKNSIRGVWFFEGKSYAVLINARKGQRLSEFDVKFLARGIYELFCLDDPNDPVPMIIDLSALPKAKKRSPVAYVVPAEESIPLPVFEEIVGYFFEALKIAGFASPTGDTRTLLDVLRRRS